ncbi:hypothetical protein ACJX0J_014715, partial [Zea mays]
MATYLANKSILLPFTLVPIYLHFTVGIAGFLRILSPGRIDRIYLLLQLDTVATVIHRDKNTDKMIAWLRELEIALTSPNNLGVCVVSLEAALEDVDPNFASTSREEMKNIDKRALEYFSSLEEIGNSIWINHSQYID